jgi:hypothetical protein
LLNDGFRLFDKHYLCMSINLKAKEHCFGVFGLNVARIGDEDDLFLSEGSSLQAPALISLIRKPLGTLVSMQDLHTRQTTAVD